MIMFILREVEYQVKRNKKLYKWQQIKLGWGYNKYKEKL